MRASSFRRAIPVAVIAGFLRATHGLGFTHRACAQSIAVGAYNIRIAGTVSFGGWGIEDWITTRRFLVFESIDAMQPDLLGFQEAFARNQGVTQQTSLGEVFQETKWEYLSWEAENEFNMNPIIVNTDRFSIVDSGTTTVDFQNDLTTRQGQSGGEGLSSSQENTSISTRASRITRSQGIGGLPRAWSSSRRWRQVSASSTRICPSRASSSPVSSCT